MMCVRVGSQPEVSDGHENVRFRGQSRSRFRAAGGLFIAISRLDDAGYVTFSQANFFVLSISPHYSRPIPFVGPRG